MQPETKIEQSPPVEQEKKEEIKNNPSEKQVEETPEQINWRKFREERAIERRQLEEERKNRQAKEAEAAALKAAMDAILNKPTPNQTINNNVEDGFEEESEEQRIERLVEQKLSARQKKEEEERTQREAAALPQNLQKAYGDFNQICSTENLDYLEFHYPEIVKAYKYMPDGFDKWSSIYQSIKKFVPNTDSRKDASKADKNSVKPQSGSTPGVSQAGMPTSSYKLDEKRKAENWARMEKIRKGLS